MVRAACARLADAKVTLIEETARVAQPLYTAAMRSATFPPIRVEPKVRAEVEAVLREGESLTQFIEEAVSRGRSLASCADRGRHPGRGGHRTLET